MPRKATRGAQLGATAIKKAKDNLAKLQAKEVKKQKIATAQKKLDTAKRELASAKGTKEKGEQVMAYDPNDPTDKAIVDGLIEEAVTDALESKTTEINRLKDKNSELLGKLRKARAGGEGGNEVNEAEIERLETELENNKSELATVKSEARQLKRDLETASKDRDTNKAALEKETGFSNGMILDTALTDALLKANVAPSLMEGARAMLGKHATVKVDGDNRNAVIGDKSVADCVGEWAASDTGKHYITAPANGGGNNGNTAPGNAGGAKKISEMTTLERNAHYKKVGEEEFTRQSNAEKEAASKT